jgi:hypothetical protein
LTVVAKIDAARGARGTRAALAALAADTLSPDDVRPRIFADPGLGIHFARLVLLEEPSSAEHGSSLIFESNFDTDDANPYTARVAQLELLAVRAFAPLASVFRDCEGFAAMLAPDALSEALEQHLVESTACYQGHTDRDLRRIRLERHLREVLIDYFSRAPKAPLRELYQRAREHVRLRTAWDAELSGLDLDGPAPKNPDQKLRSQRLAAGIIVWFQNLSFDLLVYLLLKLAKLRHWTRTDPEFDQRAVQEAWTDADRAAFLALAANEDHGLQNALTHVVPLKAKNRLHVLRAAHGYIDLMAKKQFDEIGQLGGIPTIHFAKWLLIDEGTRLLFFSNYDSSWESYLGDFVDHAAIGLNLAWTWTKLYPTVNTLFYKGGANDEERFKAWSRAQQRETQVFYAAYPELSIAALNNNTWIRSGLHQAPCAIDLKSWFRRLS